MLDASTTVPHATVQDGAPRRRFHRYRLGQWVEMRVEGDDFDCYAEDISIGGARLQTVVLAEGESVTLRLRVPQLERDSRVVEVEGVVAWVHGAQAGVRFVAQPEDLFLIFAAAGERNEPT